MQTRGKRQKDKGMILGKCPVCRGIGQVPREAPLLANLKDPAIRNYQKKSKTCPKCKGSGRIGVG